MHSKTQTHGSNFNKCTHVPTKEMWQYEFFLQVSHTLACTSSNWQQWSYEYGHQHQFNSSMRSVAHFNTQISYNSILKIWNHEIATQQFCHVQLENSRPNHKIATQKMLCTTWKLKKLYNAHTCIVCCMLEHAVCTSMTYSLPWSKTRRSMTTWSWRDWSNYLIWVFQSWSKLCSWRRRCGRWSNLLWQQVVVHLDCQVWNGKLPRSLCTFAQGAHPFV
jgi:hypothetical protein